MSMQSPSPEEMKTIIELLKKGVPTGKIANIDDNTIEQFYSLAYSTYNAGNYEDAHTIFQVLTLWMPYEYRFWMGLAGCRQALEQYDTACDAFQMAAISEEVRNPEPLYYAAVCQLKLGRKKEAIATLDWLQTVGADRPEFEDVRKRAAGLQAVLEEA